LEGHFDIFARSSLVWLLWVLALAKVWRDLLRDRRGENALPGRAREAAVSVSLGERAIGAAE